MPAINSGHNTEYNRTFSDFLPLSTTSKTLLVKVFGSGARPDIYLYPCIREREGEGGRGRERERQNNYNKNNTALALGSLQKQRKSKTEKFTSGPKRRSVTICIPSCLQPSNNGNKTGHGCEKCIKPFCLSAGQPRPLDCSPKPYSAIPALSFFPSARQHLNSPTWRTARLTLHNSLHWRAAAPVLVDSGLEPSHTEHFIVMDEGG